MYRTQKVTLFANPTLTGVPAPLVSNPVWSLDNGTLATLVPSSDGSTCDVVAKGPVGVVTVTCTATGQTVLTFLAQITIITDYADTLTLTTSVPIPQ
jgi:hypothetical protein